MPFLRSVQLPSLESLTVEVRDFLAQPTIRQGEKAQMPMHLASRLDEEVLSRTATELLEARRREREVVADILTMRVR
jgi:hypothetical protein